MVYVVIDHNGIRCSYATDHVVSASWIIAVLAKSANILSHDNEIFQLQPKISYINW